MRRRFFVFATIFVFALSSAVSVSALQKLSDSSEAVNLKTGEANLSVCEGEQKFINQKEIEIIAEKYDLGSPDDIDEIIYVPIENDIELSDLTNSEDSNVKKVSGSSKYYVKKTGSSEKRGSIIHSSWYRYPGGTMTIGQNIARTYTFNAESGVSVGNDIVQGSLKAAYGFSVTGSDYVSDSQDVKVKAKHKRNVKAYRNLRVYNYKLWKKRAIRDDKYCGSGTVKRPIGVIFVIGKNVKL